MCVSVCRGLCWWIIIGVLITLLFVFLFTLPLRYSDPVHDNEGNDDVYSPLDTAIISYPHAVCEGLHMYSPMSEFQVISTLYLLDQMPTLAMQDSGSFYREYMSNKEGDFEYWQMFLYPGSQVNFTACNIESSAETLVQFYLVKGKKNFRNWKDSRNHMKTKDINLACQQDGDNTTFFHKVDSEENYYFIFHTQVVSPPVSTTAITFSFNRVLYDISNSSIIDECHIFLNESKSCSVGIGLSSRLPVLLQLAPLLPDTLEWDADIRVNVVCSARVWLYVVIAMSVFISVGLLLLLATFIFMRFFCKTRRLVLNSPVKTENTTLIVKNSKNSVYDALPPYRPE